MTNQLGSGIILLTWRYRLIKTLDSERIKRCEWNSR